MRRWVASTAAVLVVGVALIGVAGCTNPSSSRTAATSSAAATTATASTSTSTSTPSASPSACPAPGATADAAPTDFPHQPPAPRAAVTGDSAADDALAAQGLAATRTFGGPISTAAFQHYLDASGVYLDLPVDGLLSSNPDLVTELNGLLVSAAAGAVQQVAHAPASTCLAVAFTSGWQSHADVADSDWRLTLGRFSYQVFGTVARADDPDVASTGAGAVRVTYRAAFGDTYDFDPGTAFASFGRLAAHGRAAVYLDGGVTTSRTVTVVADSAALATPGFG